MKNCGFFPVRILKLPPEPVARLNPKTADPNFVKTRWQLKNLPLAMFGEMAVFVVYGRKN